MFFLKCVNRIFGKSPKRNQRHKKRFEYRAKIIKRSDKHLKEISKCYEALPYYGIDLS